jgi:molecular chaperone DnaJ
MAKDLYATLGVTRTESLRGIQEAFRKLAKRYHPDHAGKQGTPKFQEILNAYEILSDPAKRKRYNESLAHHSADLEPIIVTRKSSSRSRPPHFGPIPQEPFSRRFSAESFFGPGWQGPAFDSLDFAVSLSPADAADGATAWLCLPIRYLCPACSGTGEQWPYPCGFCQQTGVIHHEREIRVQFPPGLPYRTLVEIPADRLGTRYRVRLFVTVDAPD